ncbi:hypothetical protein VXM60_03790 [Shewanella khirikhana]|uniref:hypothetical protein n=1 Tax=Shewanella khirikhana TaxID=1965282 RepID=UPI0030CFAA5C
MKTMQTARQLAAVMILGSSLGGCAQALCELRTDTDPYDPEADRRSCEKEVEDYMDSRAAEKQKRQDAEQQALLNEALSGRRTR